MTAHTPEPLHFRKITIYDAHGNVVALIEDNGLDEQQVATAARLVACYNGCADIENPAAASELLEAVEANVAAWDNPTSASVRMRGEAIDQARAALAKAKGETP